ncbi:hypothetical protein Taro_055937 [Colocasia esculenta]|uniref:Annexin n=1 Tax=Colocasia esculenta TaxID=4460 RepID=A0A843XS79_COLES|nr:hypothetical protein [Colocasia esculenta]
MSTISVPVAVPSPAEDVEQLHKAFEGWGTNERLIVSILAHRNAEQRRRIRQCYKETHGEDLLKSLDRELSRDFEKLVLIWTLDPAERDALLANEAARKGSSGNCVLIEIACARSSTELFLVRQAYHVRYKRSLEEDVASHTSENFRKLLVPLVSAYRYEGDEVNMTLAKSEAKILHENISKKHYENEELIRILTTRSRAQLAATFNQYNNGFGVPIDEDLKKSDPEGEYALALRAIICCLTSPDKYFEEVLRLAINKMGTDEEAVTRVIATRAEVDMQKIKEAYYKRNSVTLDRAISKDTSGDYEAMLLHLIGYESV